jgi:cell wall-associated NlpC family hydrolase
MDNYTHCGFVQVSGEPKWGDILVFTIGGTHSHLGVYLGNNLFLHQPRSRVSSTSVYGQHWRACTHAILRHKDD